MRKNGTIGSQWLTLPVAIALLACGASTERQGGPKGNVPIIIEPSVASSPAVAAALTATHDTATLNAVSDEQLNLLVRLYLDDGNMIQFYEPAPGQVVFIVVTVGGKPIDARVPGYRKLSPVDLFRALAPDQPVPEVLSAAQNRADAVRPSARQTTQAAGPPVSTPSALVAASTTKTAPVVKPLDCSGCTNWCDYSCWSCRESGFGGGCAPGDWYDWCYQDAYNGAYSDNSGGSDGGNGDICSDQGTATLTITSDIFSGNYSAGPQQEANAYSYQGSFCLFDEANRCDQHIKFSVSGSNIHVHFSGSFADP